jgi:cyclophilin family peptidyl-prolyl cis-trans isomerase
MTRKLVRCFVRGSMLMSLSCLTMAGCNKSEETPAAANPAAPTNANSSAAKPNAASSQAAPVTADSYFSSRYGADAGGGATVSAQGVRTVLNVEMPSPTIVMKTSLGDIHLKLNQKAAPRTVSNFVDYVINKHYDGTIVHEIDGGLKIQFGGYDEKLVSKPVRYAIPNESTNGLKNKKGTIAMSHAPNDPNGATAQFFINLADNPKLDRTGNTPAEAGYCVFGEVVQGLDVLEKIAQVRTAQVQGFERMPTQTVSVQTMKLMR